MQHFFDVYRSMLDPRWDFAWRFAWLLVSVFMLLGFSLFKMIRYQVAWYLSLSAPGAAIVPGVWLVEAVVPDSGSLLGLLSLAPGLALFLPITWVGPIVFVRQLVNLRQRRFVPMTAGSWIGCAVLVLLYLWLDVFPLLAIPTTGCDRPVTARALSPDGKMVAEILEEVCTGFVPTADVMVVIHPPDIAAVPADVVASTEFDRREDDIPKLEWQSPDRITLTYPVKAHLNGSPRESYRGVHIDLKFDPDDPVLRQQILEQREQNEKEFEARMRKKN